MSRPRITLLLLFAASTVIAAASGPADRLPTDPKSVVSATHAAAEPVSVADLLQTRRIGGSTLSPDGAHIAYISNASGRLNLWQMNIDGSSAQQLLKSNDRQASPAFTRDGKEIVYMQDKGGDELYDLYAVPAAGGEPRNITNTDHTSEVGPLFSPDGKTLAYGSKEKVNPYHNVAVVPWPAGAARLLTHESDLKASWDVVCWSPDGHSLFAVRTVALDDSDVYRIDVASGKAENLTTHQGKERVFVSDISPDGNTLIPQLRQEGRLRQRRAVRSQIEEVALGHRHAMDGAARRVLPRRQNLHLWDQRRWKNNDLLRRCRISEGQQSPRPSWHQQLFREPHFVHLRRQLSSLARRLHASRESLPPASRRGAETDHSQREPCSCCGSAAAIATRYLQKLRWPTDLCLRLDSLQPEARWHCGSSRHAARRPHRPDRGRLQQPRNAAGIARLRGHSAERARFNRLRHGVPES